MKSFYTQNTLRSQVKGRFFHNFTVVLPQRRMIGSAVLVAKTFRKDWRFSRKKCLGILSGIVLMTIFAGSVARGVDNIIPIASITNDNYAGILPGLPSGNVTLGGVAFNIPASYPDWISNPNSQAPDLSATLSMNISQATSVRLLLNTGNTYAAQMQIGDHIGDVILNYASGPSDTLSLLVGNNIREWAVGNTEPQPIINTFTDPNLEEVYQGDNNGGIACVVDMLTIPLDGTRTLTGIALEDESIANIGQTNPVLILRGATVQSVPEPEFAFLVALGFAATCAQGGNVDLLV